MSNKPKALVIFTPAFPKDEADTEWMPSLQLTVKAINRNFKELTIIVFAFQYPHHTGTYTWNGNKVIAFNGMHRKKVSRSFMWLSLIRVFKKTQRQYNIQGIFSMWCGECSFLAKYCASLSRVIWRCWILGGDARLPNKFIKRIKPQPEHLVAMSDFLADQFYRNHGVKPAHMIINAVEPCLFDPMPVEKRIDIMGAGGFSVLKQYNIFVDVVAEVKRLLPDINAVLCGSGEELENLKEIIFKKGLQDTVRLPGFTKHIDTLETMQHTKIFLHPSSYEGFSTVCLEAIYAGAQVISFIKPMHYDIPHWHIVKTKEEMVEKALLLLQDTQTVPQRILLKTFDAVSHDVIELFNIA